MYLTGYSDYLTGFFVNHFRYLTEMLHRFEKSLARSLVYVAMHHIYTAARKCDRAENILLFYWSMNKEFFLTLRYCVHLLHDCIRLGFCGFQHDHCQTYGTGTGGWGVGGGGE